MEQKKPRELERAIYLGPSMHPTLRPGCSLDIIPYNGQRIRKGDVVVFIPPGEVSKIAHRTVSVCLEGVRTKGDNCNQIDPWILSPDQVLGRVAYGWRGGKRRRIFGGALGEFHALVVRAIRGARASTFFLLRPIYDWLSRSGIIRRWFAARIKTRVISLNRAEGTELQLVMSQRVIGRWLPGKTGWHIRRPFRLFVDEASLPKNIPSCQLPSRN